MKKLVSLVLTVVLMVSMFAMLGTTASAETHYVGKTLVDLTFDGDAPYGIVAHRFGSNGLKYETEKGYVTLNNTGSNNGNWYIGINGNVGETPVGYNSSTNDFDSLTAAQKEAYNNLFKFEAGKTYRVSYDVKYLAGTEGDYRENGIFFMNNPLLKTADANRSIDRVTMLDCNDRRVSWTPVEDKLAEDTDWYNIYMVFTVKADDPGFAMALTAGQRHQSGTGVVAANSYAAFDNIKIQEVVASYGYNDRGVVTMNEELTWKNASGAPAEIVENYDAEHGNVLKVSSSAITARGSFDDDKFVVTSGKKYYITFDAKADADGTINTCFTQLGNTTGYRYFFSGYNILWRGTKYYVNGVDKNVVSMDTPNADIFPVTTEWATYGLVVDTNDATFKSQLLGVNPTYTAFWDKTVSFAFGATTTAYFDNIKIVEIVEPTYSTVPEKDESAKYSIREESATKSAGLRFKGDVDATVKAAADEIGFVVAPIELVVTDANWYKLDTLNANAKTVVAYNGSKDVVYEEKNDAVSYQLVLTNLGALADRRFATVMYVKTGDTYEYISLGEMSYNQVLAEYAIRGN